MLGFLKRRFSGGQADKTRALDAASHRGPLRHAGGINNLNTDIAAGTPTIRARAAYLARNSPHIAAAVNALVSNLVGSGIRPVSQHPDTATRELLHDLWARFVDEADHDGQIDHYGQQAVMARQMVEAGESFGVFHDAMLGEGRTVPFTIQVLHPTHCPLDTVPLETATGRVVRCGIEFDRQGRRTGFYFWPERPDDPFAFLNRGSWQPVRVPADDVMHLMLPVEPGQLRGLSWLNGAVGPVTQLDAFQAAALRRAQLSNMLVGAVVDPSGQGLNLFSEQEDNAVKLEPGTFLNLKGQMVEFFDPKESQHYGEFVKSHLKSLAAALGVPYEILSHDAGDANFSSSRVQLAEFQKRLEYYQYGVIVFRVCKPVWNRFVRRAVLAGHIPLSAYTADPTAFHRVEWLPPKLPWVDPEADAAAEALMVEKKFKSRSMVIAGLGYNPEQVDREIAADAQRLRELGVETAPAPVPPPAETAP